MFNRRKIESLTIYVIGTLLLFIGLLFKFTNFSFGELFYDVSEFINPVLVYILIVLGLGIIVYQLISNKDFSRIYNNLRDKNKDSSVLIVLLISYLIIPIGPLLPRLIMYVILNIYALIVCLYFLVIKKDVLYITTVVLILLQFFDNYVLLEQNDNIDSFFFVIIVLVALTIFTILVDSIYKYIKKKDFKSNVIFIFNNLLVVLMLVLIHNGFGNSSNTVPDNYHFTLYLPIVCIPILVLHLLKKSNRIVLFK